MLKALLLDMDETLCDTASANTTAQQRLAQKLASQFGREIDSQAFAEKFLKGIYKVWTPEERERYQPFRDQYGEQAYRQRLTLDLLGLHGIDATASYANQLHEDFEVERMAAFNFFPAIRPFLLKARERFTLVVITNGPEFSQIPKINAVNLSQYVDHILIGGQEPEEKPARSIFEKAMKLACCQPKEAVHFGDSLSADIAGANNAGICSVWIRHGQKRPSRDEPEPVHTLDSPNDIPELVEKLWW